MLIVWHLPRFLLSRQEIIVNFGATNKDCVRSLQANG